MEKSELNSLQPIPSEQNSDIQNPEQEANKRPVKRFLKPGLIITGLIIILALAGVFSFRLLLPTRPGWDLIPLHRNNVFAQNLLIWMTGRCYARKPLLDALSEAGKILKNDVRAPISDTSMRVDAKVANC